MNDTKRYKEFKSDFTAPSFRYVMSTRQGESRDDAVPLLQDGSLDAVMRAMNILMTSGDIPKGMAYDAARAALDWLETLRQRLEQANRTFSDIKLIETTSVMANSDGEPIKGTERPEVYAWNENVISEAAVTELLRTGAADYSNKVIKLTIEQAANLFPDAKFEPESEG